MWPTVVIAVLNAFLVMACYFYSHRKSFNDEYSPKNKQVLGVLVEDFYESVSKWASDRKKRGRKDELDELMDSLDDLFAKSTRLSAWNAHITDGKAYLSHSSSYMVVAGISFAAVVFSLGALLDSESNVAIIMAFVMGYFGLVYLARGIGQWRSLCGIESRIDDYHSSLTLGKSRVVNDDEDDDDS